MKCQVCGAAATVSVTEVEVSDGAKSLRHLCAAHAQAAGHPVPNPAADQLRKLRTLIAFIKTNQRMPSPTELGQLGGFGQMPVAPAGSQAFQDQLAYLEAVADFIEDQGRLPTEQELPPDPF